MRPRPVRAHRAGLTSIMETPMTKTTSTPTTRRQIMPVGAAGMLARRKRLTDTARMTLKYLQEQRRLTLAELARAESDYSYAVQDLADTDALIAAIRAA